MLTLPSKSSTGAPRSDNHLILKRLNCWASRTHKSRAINYCTRLPIFLHVTLKTGRSLETRPHIVRSILSSLPYYILRQKNCESKENYNSHNSSVSSSRPKNVYIKGPNLLRSPTSPIPLSSSMVAHSPNHIDDDHINHTCHPQSPNSTHTPQYHNSHYQKEPVPLCQQVINLKDLPYCDNSAGVPQQTCVLNQDLHLTSTGACETTFLNEQGFREIKTESNAFGDDASPVETSGYQSAESRFPRRQQWDYDNVFEPQIPPKGIIINYYTVFPWIFPVGRVCQDTDTNWGWEQNKGQVQLMSLHFCTRVHWASNSFSTNKHRFSCSK